MGRWNFFRSKSSSLEELQTFQEGSAEHGVKCLKAALVEGTTEELYVLKYNICSCTGR